MNARTHRSEPIATMDAVVAEIVACHTLAHEGRCADKASTTRLDTLLERCEIETRSGWQPAGEELAAHFYRVKFETAEGEVTIKGTLDPAPVRPRRIAVSDSGDYRAERYLERDEAEAARWLAAKLFHG